MNISPNAGKRWSRNIGSQFSRVCADATSPFSTFLSKSDAAYSLKRTV